MLPQSIKNIQFHFSVFMTIFSVFFFFLFISLGIWQLHRYEYKKILLKNYQQRISMKPLSLKELNQYSDKNFLPIKVKGHYENNKVILLQNRIHQHQVGYEVIMPFKAKNQNKILLVNRGWIAEQKNLTKKSKLFSVYGQQTIQGYVRILGEYQFILGEALINPGHWPLLIQKIDFHQLHQLLKTPLYHFVLRLDPQEANGFVRDWKLMSVLPERHLGYAIQWFAMAFVLVIAFLAFSIRRKKGHKDG